MGGWNAGTIERPRDFAWSYVPFPGSDDAADNQTLFGKIDMSLAVAEDTPVPELASAYLAAFSEPDNYNAFANATGYIPTQPTAVLDNTLGAVDLADPAGGQLRHRPRAVDRGAEGCWPVGQRLGRRSLAVPRRLRRPGRGRQPGPGRLGVRPLIRVDP